MIVPATAVVNVSKNSHSPDSSAKLVRSELKKHSDKKIVIIDKKARDEDLKISEK